MIKPRLLFSLSILGIGTVIMFISVFRTTRPNTTESTIPNNQAVLAQIINPESSQSSIIDQQLPHPGLLPNSPFYWVAMVRDRIQLITTTNPSDKADLMIEYADKRLHSGIILIKNGQQGIGITTITKAEKYLAKTNELLQTLDPDPELTDNFRQSLQTHYIVLRQVMDAVEVSNQPIIQQMINLNTAILNQYPQQPELNQPQNQNNNASPSALLR